MHIRKIYWVFHLYVFLLSFVTEFVFFLIDCVLRPIDSEVI